MTGAEYLTTAVLADLWRSLDAAFDVELGEAKLSVQEFSSVVSRLGIWSVACTSILRRTGRTRKRHSRFWPPTRQGFSAAAKAKHLPLDKALQEYSGAKNRERCFRC